MRKPLVLGNWKMNGSTQSNAALISELLSADLGYQAVDCGVAVPYVYLSKVLDVLKGTQIVVGAQDVSVHDAGAYTGEVSAQMLRDIEVNFTLIGHSERRTYHAETDQLILAKVQKAIAAGLTAVVCIGETLEEFERTETEAVLTKQLSLLCKHLSTLEWQQVVIAYEPVWAIGTGKVASPEYAQKVHHYIREMVKNVDSELADQIKILYGGSVKAENAAQLRAMPDIDGALVGGASLVAEQFVGICRNFR